MRNAITGQGMTNQYLENQLGLSGVDNISDTNTHTGNWFGFQAIGDTVINTVVESNATGNINGQTISDGVIIYGSFNSVQLTSGRIRAYRV